MASTHYKPKALSHDMLQSMKPGTRLHLHMHSGAVAHLKRSVADLWESEFGTVSTSTVHQSMPGVHHAEVHDA